MTNILSDLLGKTITATEYTTSMRETVVIRTTGIVRAITPVGDGYGFALLIQIERRTFNGVVPRGDRPPGLRLVTVTTVLHEIYVGDQAEA